MYYDDLLDPESELDEVVGFHRRGHVFSGPVGPDVGVGEEVEGLEVEFLEFSLVCGRMEGGKEVPSLKSRRNRSIELASLVLRSEVGTS